MKEILYLYQRNGEEYYSIFNAIKESLKLLEESDPESLTIKEKNLDCQIYKGSILKRLFTMYIILRLVLLRRVFNRTNIKYTL